MNKTLILSALLSFPLYAQISLSGITPKMGQSVKTLNQMDQSQDGKLSRNQGQELEEEKGAPAESYNTQGHRDYVKRRKFQKHGKK